MTPDTAAPVDGIELFRTTDIADSVLDEVYSAVLVPSFPPAELIDRDEFLASYVAPNELFPGIVAVHDGVPVGAALGERHLPTGVVLLGYLAVLPEYRSLRIGGRLLARATAEWSAIPGTSAVLAEIEDPRHHRDEGHGDPVARRRFYARAGAREVPIAYFQPSLRPGSPRIHGMLLISLNPQQTTLDSAALLTFLDDYLTACEGPPSATDTAYLAMRSSIERWGPTIELAALDELG